MSLDIDHSYLQAMNLQIVSGRGFSQDLKTDKEAVLINESLARRMNWDQPLGKTITRNGTRQVIGVVQDF